MTKLLWILLFVVSCGYFTNGEGSLKVSLVLAPPYVYKGKDGEYSGYLPDLLDRMGYNITITEADKYGSLLSNGTWTGMISDLADGRADVAGLLTVSSQRMDAVDFSYPLQSVGPVIVMKKPPKERTSLGDSVFKLLEPFEFSIWLMSMLAMLVTGTVLYLISHLNPYEWRRMAKDREATLREAESFTCLNSFWFVVSGLFLQGYVRTPRSMGARIVVFVWWGYVIMFLFLYLASLTNYLSIGPAQYAVSGYSKVRDLRQLAANTEIDVAVVGNGSTEMALKNSLESYERDLYHRVIATRNKFETPLTTVEQIINYLRQLPYADFAAILESDIAKFHSHQLPCNLYMVTDGSVTKQLALAFRKGFSDREKISKQIVELQQSGVLRELENKWFKSKCLTATIRPESVDEIVVKSFYRMDLATFSGALLLLVVGIAAGALVTVVEILIYRCAETHVEDEDNTGMTAKPPNQNNVEHATSDRLLPGRGGATQV